MRLNVIFACLLIFSSGCLIGGAGRESEKSSLKGRAYFSGSEPNLQLMVESGDGVYCLEGLSVEEQRRIQDRQASFEGSFIEGFCGDGGGRVFAVSNYTLIQ